MGMGGNAVHCVSDLDLNCEPQGSFYAQGVRDHR